MVVENASTQFHVRRYGQGRFHKETCHVPVETTLIVEVNGLEITSLACTPTHLEALAWDFYFLPVRSGALKILNHLIWRNMSGSSGSR